MSDSFILGTCIRLMASGSRRFTKSQSYIYNIYNFKKENLQHIGHIPQHNSKPIKIKYDNLYQFVRACVLAPRERETETETETERQRERETETDRQTDRQRHRERQN